jgi:hypothetical protein
LDGFLAAIRRKGRSVLSQDSLRWTDLVLLGELRPDFAEYPDDSEDERFNGEPYSEPEDTAVSEDEYLDRASSSS